MRRPAAGGRPCRDRGQLRPPPPARSVPLEEDFGDAALCACHNLPSPAENAPVPPGRGEPGRPAGLAEAASAEGKAGAVCEGKVAHEAGTSPAPGIWKQASSPRAWAQPWPWGSCPRAHLL